MENDGPSLTMTVEQAACALGISRGLAYDLARQNRLPVLHCGRRLLVSRKMFEAYLNGEWQPPTSNGNAHDHH